MKAIVLNDHLYPDGGADVVALASAEALAAQGVDVTLLVADRLRPDDTAPRRARLVCTGQYDLLNDPNALRAATQGLWNGTAAKALSALLATHDPRDTVVHLHSWTKALSSSVVRTAVASGFPVVCTLHEYFTVCPTGTLFDFNSGSICVREPMSLDCMTRNCDARNYGHKLYRVARQAVQRSIGGLPGSIREFIAVSEFSRRLLEPQLPAGSRIHHLGNPIEVAQAEPADVAANRNFLCVARLYKPKGQALFLEACERAGVQAVCVGEGPDRADLQARFPKARFTGTLSRAEVTAEMRQARALVLPSIWYETQGLVVAEAAALGVPAIVSDRCAAVDFVEHERTGLLVGTDDPSDLAAAMDRLARDAALSCALGREAAARYWAHPHTLAAHAAGLIGIYEQVLASARGNTAAQPTSNQAMA